MRLAGLGDLTRAVAATILAGSVAYGCTVAPSSTPSTVECGPLATNECAAAVQVAKAALAPGEVPTSIRVASPTPDHTCPPSGGPVDGHACVVIVVVSTTGGNIDVGLLRTSSGGWIDGAMIR